MSLTKDDKKWVQEEITRGVETVKPHGWSKALLLAGRFGSVAAYLSLIVALLGGMGAAVYAAFTQHKAATDFAVGLQKFEDDTKSHFDAIDSRLTRIDSTLSNLSLSMELLRPISAESAKAISRVAQDAINMHAKLDPALVQRAGAKLLEFPSSPDKWDATSRLVTYRFQPERPKSIQAPDCVDQPIAPPEASALRVDNTTGKVLETRPIGSVPQSAFVGVRSTLSFHDCTLSLEANSKSNSLITNWFDEAGKSNPRVQLRILQLTNVRVIYHGGPLIAVTSIQLLNCTLDFRFSGIPTTSGSALTHQLLAASNPENVIANLPKS